MKFTAKSFIQYLDQDPELELLADHGIYLVIGCPARPLEWTLYKEDLETHEESDWSDIRRTLTGESPISCMKSLRKLTGYYSYISRRAKSGQRA